MAGSLHPLTRSGRRLVRLPGVAPGWWPCASTSLAGRYSPLKSQPRKVKGRERSGSRPMPFQQRTNTSCYLVRYQPAVSRRLFRCLGAHLLRSPQYVNLKFVSFVLVTLSSGRGQTPPVRLLRSSSPNSTCRRKTSSRCRFVPIHRLSVFRCSFLFMLFRENKKPCLHAVSRVKKFHFDSLPAYTVSIQITFGLFPDGCQG